MTLVSMLGVMIGIAALVITLSVMGGFEEKPAFDDFCRSSSRRNHQRTPAIRLEPSGTATGLLQK